MKKATREDVEKYLSSFSSPIVPAIYIMIDFAYVNTEHKKTSELFQILCGLIDVFYKRVELLAEDQQPTANRQPLKANPCTPSPNTLSNV